MLRILHTIEMTGTAKSKKRTISRKSAMHKRVFFYLLVSLASFCNLKQYSFTIVNSNNWGSIVVLRAVLCRNRLHSGRNFGLLQFQPLNCKNSVRNSKSTAWPKGKGVIITTTLIAWSGFNPYPRHVVASLDKALYHDYLSWVALNKQQVQWMTIRRNLEEHCIIGNSTIGANSSKHKLVITIKSVRTVQ